MRQRFWTIGIGERWKIPAKATGQNDVRRKQDEFAVATDFSLLWLRLCELLRPWWLRYETRCKCAIQIHLPFATCIHRVARSVLPGRNAPALSRCHARGVGLRAS